MSQDVRCQLEQRSWRRMTRFNRYYYPMVSKILAVKVALMNQEDKTVTTRTHVVTFLLTDLPQESKNPNLRLNGALSMALSDLPEQYRKQIELGLSQCPPEIFGIPCVCQVKVQGGMCMGTGCQHLQQVLSWAQRCWRVGIISPWKWMRGRRRLMMLQRANAPISSVQWERKWRRIGVHECNKNNEKNVEGAYILDVTTCNPSSESRMLELEVIISRQLWILRLRGSRLRSLKEKTRSSWLQLYVHHSLFTIGILLQSMNTLDACIMKKNEICYVLYIGQCIIH